MSQAELLTRIWKPKVIICPGPLPDWVSEIPESSVLAEIPIFLLQTPGTANQVKAGIMTCISYQVDDLNLDTAALTDQFYQQLVGTTLK